MTFPPITILETQLKEINRRRQELEEFYDNLEDPSETTETKEVKDVKKKRRNPKSNIQQKSKAGTSTDNL